MSLKIFVIVIIFFQCSASWNPYCLVSNCEDEKTDTPKDTFLIPSDYNPYCLVFECKNNDKKPDTTWDPSCWFKDCSSDSEQKQLKFWTYDYWNNAQDTKTWKEKIACIFKECPEAQIEVKEEKVQSKTETYIRGMFKSLKNYLNAAKPQEIVIKNIFTSELNPYCWITECCNENTLQLNLKQLTDLIQNRLYGQHLVNTLVDAIASHWGNKHHSRKALVLSFHGPVGTGKNYVSDMIANSLFKLGVKSKYVHHFSGRVHFMLQDNSNSYKDDLYSWLKGNITQCNKQLFIFDEADHMPEQVLNSILPMLDYREKVDGADYRNSIFIFLSNAGSELILEKLNTLYQNNKTRQEIEINDFERDIIVGIFNLEGGFYHSDTISHNLIDHYIPFLPMEEKHVEECIIDQFRERNVHDPTEEHVLDVLNSVSWGQASKLKYAKTGCKTIGSKVAYLCEKYYKLKNEEKEGEL